MAETPYFFPAGESKTQGGFFSKTPRLLSLDFDGTLAKIAPTPAEAHLSEDLRTVLWGLVHLPETRLVITSGRSIANLRQKVRLPGLVYVGNHGMDVSPPSAGWGLPALREWTRQTLEVQKRLEPLASQWPGSFLEMKGPDLSLHYRRLKPWQVKEIIPEAIKAVQDLPFTSRRGKCVLEFKPSDSPDKGKALERLAGRYFKMRTLGVCVHIGDDTTDEDAFRALRRMGRRSLGLKVGGGSTRAHYRLRNLQEVRRFLKLFLATE